MSRIIKPPVADDLDYPTTDGKPMAETDIHIVLMMALIQTLRALFADQPRVYVSGNILVFYERGNKRKHVSPDVFMVRGVPNHLRDNYLVWRERKAPQVVIELTSRTTRRDASAPRDAAHASRWARIVPTRSAFAIRLKVSPLGGIQGKMEPSAR